MRLTKIVATVGPATSGPDAIRELVDAGVDVFRLNFSHGTQDDHRTSLERVREAARLARRQVAILQDLSGPKIRIGRLEGGRPIPLQPGDVLRIVAGEFVGGPGRVSTAYADLPKAVSRGDRLLLDDGRIELQVEATDGLEITSTVRNGGLLGERKGINAPGVTLPAVSLTPKDEADLRFGVAHGVDAIALSFVQSAEDLDHARRMLAALDAPETRIVAKIERPEAVAHIGRILDACDGVMVARGDLGLEVPIEQVPRIQKEITRAARLRGVPVIVATQVLESMREEPLPTRAEVSDAANAVDDGVDAIMLSGETAVGKHPVRVVRTLDAVIRDAESLPLEMPLPVGDRVIDLAHSRALCEAAVTLAAAGVARALVAVTRQGRTARVLSAFRPVVPIYAVTSNDALARRLTFHRGVVPMRFDGGEGVESAAHVIAAQLVSDGSLSPGDRLVLVSVAQDLSTPRANFVRLVQVPPGAPRTED
jgi:pyruvate kinase